MHNQIQKFYNNKIMRQEVYDIIKITIDDMSIDYIKNGKDASGFKDAYDALDTAFSRIKKECK